MFPRSRSPQDPGYAHRWHLSPSFLPFLSPDPPFPSSHRFPDTNNHAPLSIPVPHDSRAPWLDPHPSLSIRMNPDILPPPNSHAPHARPLRRLRSFLRSYGRLRTSVLFGAFILVTLVLYTTFSPPREAPWHTPLDWRKQTRPPPRPHPEYAPGYANPKEPLLVATTPTSPSTSTDALATSTGALEAPPLPSQTSLPDVLTLEQIRDIVAPTRGFFSRDYSLGLGWNNVSCTWRRF